MVASLAAAALTAAACDQGREPEPLLRRGQLGSLRDLVLFERSAGSGGPFFLDRFEVTRGDWAEFAASPAGAAVAAAAAALRAPGDAVLPQSGVDLAQSRAFARWRYCRLPRSDEWTFACTTDGRDTYPWGSRPDAARANTSDLGVFAALPVGTFESGRYGDGPYDLIGNVAEWTETVPAAWFQAQREAMPPLSIASRRVLRAPGLAAWSLVPAVASPSFLVAAAGDQAPREVLGADFATSMHDAPQQRGPGERGDTLGVRLCTTPAELLSALAADVTELAGEDRRQLERFCARRGHAAALRLGLQQVELPPRARAAFEAMLR
jgi:hypothetical protein